MSVERARLIGIDVGTTAVKATLFDTGGRVVDAYAAPYPTRRPAPGHAEQDAGDWERAMTTALERFAAEVDPATIAAIGLTAQTNTHLFVGTDGAPLAPAIVWQDVRATEDAARLDAGIDEATRLAWWGAPMPIDASHALARMAWMRRTRPERWERTASVLLPKDHCLRFLTGELASDALSNIGLVGADGEHVPAMLALVPGAAERLPPLAAADTIAGTVRADLPFAGTPIAVGTMDAWAGMLGLGVARAGDAMYLGGTSEILGIVGDAIVPTPGVLVMPERLGVRLHVGPTQSGWASLAWCAALLGVTPAEAIALAETHDPGRPCPLFLPHLEGERAPLWDANARGLFLGLDSASDRAALARAVLDGVACSARWLLDALVRSADGTPERLRLGGGGARSALWNRLRADTLGVPLEVVRVADAGTLGAAVLGAVAAGSYGSVGEACDALVEIDHVVEPDPDGVTRQAERVALARDAYAATRELSARFVRMGG